MGWIDEDRLNRGRPQERPSFQDAMEAARRIIPEDPDEPPSFTYAARNVLSGILYGLQQSCPRRVSIVELVQTVGTYLTLMTEDAPQREHDLREVFNAMRWAVRTGSPWRYMPNDLPPWEAVYQQSQRWLAAGVFEAGVFEATARAVDARERRAGRVRRGQAEEGLEGAHGRRRSATSWRCT